MELTQDNIVTGVPENDWTLTLAEGQCVDVVPVGTDSWAVRPYGFNDKFRGDLADVEYLGRPSQSGQPSAALTSTR